MKQMIRLALMAILLYGAFSRLHAQTVQLKQVWKKSLTGASGDEILNEMAVHPDGTVLVAGRYTGGTVNVGGLSLAAPSYSDGFLVQYNTAGTPQWATQYSYNNNETFFGVTYAPGKIPFAVGGANTGFSNYTYSNLAVVTTTTSGVLSASLSANGTGINNYFCVTTDEAGKVYAGGWYMAGNSQMMDINFGRSPVVTLFGSGTQDGIITKYDANRNVQWTRKIGAGGSDQVKKMVVSNGYIYAVGTFQGTVDFDPGSGTFSLSAPSGVDNGFLLKMDTAGNFVNAWMMASVSSCGFSDIALNAAGHLFIAAYASGGVVDINLGAGINNVGSAGGDDAFLLKIDTGANPIWHRQFGSLGSDRIQRLALNNNSDVYLAGYFTSPTIDMGYPNSLLLTNASSSMINSDGFVAGYDSSGNSLCAYRYGSPTGNDNMMAISFDTANTLYVAGYYNGSIETEFAPGYSSISTAVSGYDAFVIKYNTICPYLAKAVPFDQVACSGKSIGFNTVVFGNNLSYQWKLNGANISNGTKYTGADSNALWIDNLQAADTGNYYLSVSRTGCATLNTDTVMAKINNGLVDAMPVNLYRFEGNMMDERGGAAATSPLVSYGTDRFSNASKSYSQAYASYYIDVPNITSVDYSVSMWVNHNYNGAQTLIYGGGSNRELQISGNKLGMNNGTFVDFGYTLNPNEWYHIGYVKEGSQCRVYVNGVKVYENDNLLSAGTATVSTILGTTSSDGMIGKCDELGIYDVALTDENMHSLYLMPQQLNVKKQMAVCVGSTTIVQTKINGALNYQWYKDGVALTNNTLYAGVTSDSLIITNAQAAESGKYVLQGINDCVLFSSDTTALYVGNVQLTQSLLSRFQFNGTLTDATGTLTATGTINYTTASHYSDNTQSASFQGASGRTSVSFAPVANDTLSVSMWFYPSNVTGVTRTLLGANTSNARHLALSSTNKLGYINAAGSFVSSSVTNLAPSSWYHLVIVKAGNTQKIYLNGQLVMNDVNSFLNSLTANALTRIGGSSANLEPAYGLIDDVKLYTRELNPLEVTGIYKLIETKTNPVAVSSCNGIDNVFLTASFDNSDTTQYTMQWKKNGVVISNGSKYSGVNARTLWVLAAEYADTGMYTMEAVPSGLSCVTTQTTPVQLSIAAPNSLTDSLSFHLRFSNTTADASLFKRAIAATTAISYTADANGAPTAAASFNGSSSMVSASGVLPITQTSFTVMAWFKANQSTGGIVSTANQYANTPTLFHSWLYIGTDNKLRGKAYNGNTTTMASVADVNDNQWHHAALVVTPTTQYLYLDGVEIANQVANGNSVPATYVIVGNMFGGWPNTLAGWSNYLQGNIDEVKVYNRSLTANEINRSAIPMGFAFSANKSLGFCNATPVVIASQGQGSGVAYQWYKNGVALANSTNLTGTDSIALSFGSIGLSDSGNYQCAITKNCYTVLSDTIKVGVYSSIVVTANPQSGNVCPGNTIVLGVKANGASVQYQWKKSGISLVNGGRISGVTSDTLRITGATFADADSYTVEMTDACLNSATSAAAAITVNSSVYAGATTTKVVYPLNGNGDASVAALNGTTTTFLGASNRFSSANAALDFQRTAGSRVVLPANMFAAGNPAFTVSIWFKTSTATTTMGLIGTASGNPTANPSSGWSPILFVNNSGKLSGKFYDINGTAPQSTASVTDGVWHQALLTGNGSSQSLYLDGVLVGTSTGTYSTTATPATIIGASYSASNGWSGHTNGWQYFNGTLDDARFYTSYFTANEVLTQYSKPEMVSQPSVSNAVCMGAAAPTISVTAGGTNLVYQWFKNGVAVNNSATISGATTNAISISNVQAADTGYYYARIVNGCNFIASDSSRMLLNNVPEVLVSPTNQSSCVGGSVVLSVATSGYGLTYQWQKEGVNLADGGNISGATASVLTISSLTDNDTLNYRCIVSNTCGSDTSASAKVSSGSTLQILQQPVSQNVCANSAAILYVKSTDPLATYTWKRNGTTLSSSNNDTIVFGAFNGVNVGNYQVIVNSVCGIDTSDIATLSILDITQIISQPNATISFCGTNPIVISAIANGSNLTYQWQKGGVNIPNATSATYTNLNPLSTDTGNYQVVVSGDCGPAVVSSVCRVSSAQSVSITTQPINSLTICSGNNSYVNLNVTATGSVLGYQWYKNGSPINNQAGITGATTQNLQFLNSVLGAGSYTCKVIGICDTVISTATVFAYTPWPNVNSSLEAKTICAGGNVNFKVSATNATQFRWYINGVMANDFQGKIQGAYTDSITAFGVTAADLGGNVANVYAWVSNGCPNQETTSNMTTLTLTNGIGISSQSDTLVSVCENQPVMIYARTSAEATYVWKRNGILIPNETNDTLSFGSVTSADNALFTCEATSTCGNVSSLPIRLNVLPIIVPVITKNGNVLSTTPFLGYEWYQNGVAIANATQQTFTPTEAGIYSVRVVNISGCLVFSAEFNFTFTGITDVLGDGSSIRVFPNPTTGDVFIEVLDGRLNSVVELFDISGKQVLTVEIKSGKVDVSSLPAGMYMMKLTSEEGRVGFVKIAKQ